MGARAKTARRGPLSPALRRSRILPRDFLPRVRVVGYTVQGLSRRNERAKGFQRIVLGILGVSVETFICAMSVESNPDSFGLNFLVKLPLGGKYKTDAFKIVG